MIKYVTVYCTPTPPFTEVRVSAFIVGMKHEIYSLSVDAHANFAARFSIRAFFTVMVAKFRKLMRIIFSTDHLLMLNDLRSRFHIGADFGDLRIISSCMKLKLGTFYRLR